MLGFLLSGLIGIRFESHNNDWDTDYSGWAKEPRHAMPVITFREELSQLLTFTFIEHTIGSMLSGDGHQGG